MASELGAVGLPSVSSTPLPREHLPPRERLGKGYGALLVGGLTVAPVAVLLAVSVALAQSGRFERAWPNTDFSRLAVNLDEGMSGGPPRDGIPTILDAVFIPASQETRLDDREPVMTYVPDSGPARAYPDPLSDLA